MESMECMAAEWNGVMLGRFGSFCALVVIVGHVVVILWVVVGHFVGRCWSFCGHCRHFEGAALPTSLKCYLFRFVFGGCPAPFLRDNSWWVILWSLWSFWSTNPSTNHSSTNPSTNPSTVNPSTNPSTVNPSTNPSTVRPKRGRSPPD